MEPSRKIRVLLVDDEKDFVDILSKRIEVRDFDVTCVYNGDDALALIEAEAFDVVLLDVLMPGKSGLDTLKAIKALNPMIPIIMLTGHARVDTAIEGMELGAYDYLIKPTEIEALIEKIELAHSHKAVQADKMRQTAIPEKIERRGLRKVFDSISERFKKT